VRVSAREGAPQTRQVADRFHLLQNFRETVERQLGRYEAPVPEARISPDDDQVTAPPTTPPDCASDVAEQTHLMRRGRLAARQQLFDEIRALFEGGNSIGEIARKLGPWPPTRRKMGSSHRLAGPQHDGVDAFQPCIFQRVAGAPMGGRHHQGSSLVRRDTPSRLYGVLHPSRAFPFPMARRAAFPRRR
jgi:hypothetical protein